MSECTDLSFSDIIQKIGYAERNFDLKYVFHGCLSTSIRNIMERGLMTKRGEPSLTFNPASALLKYANPALNSNFNYSGGLDAAINTLSKGGSISKHPEETLIFRAMKYWENDSHSGGVFVFNLDKVPFYPVGTGSIFMNKTCITGEISKWIYCHLSSDSISANAISGIILPSKSWRYCFNLFHPLKQRRIPSCLGTENPFAKLMSDPSLYLSINAEDAVSERLAENLSISFLYQELRKLFLSILQSQGFSIVKTNKDEKETWVFYPPKLVLEQMQRLRYDDEKIELLRKMLIEIMKNFYEESR